MTTYFTRTPEDGPTSYDQAAMRLLQAAVKSGELAAKACKTPDDVEVALFRALKAGAMGGSSFVTPAARRWTRVEYTWALDVCRNMLEHGLPPRVVLSVAEVAGMFDREVSETVPMVCLHMGYPLPSGWGSLDDDHDYENCPASACRRYRDAVSEAM